MQKAKQEIVSNETKKSFCSFLRGDEGGVVRSPGSLKAGRHYFLLTCLGKCLQLPGGLVLGYAGFTRLEAGFCTHDDPDIRGF